jgi:uncharacterized membrane protein
MMRAERGKVSYVWAAATVGFPRQWVRGMPVMPSPTHKRKNLNVFFEKRLIVLQAAVSGLTVIILMSPTGVSLEILGPVLLTDALNLSNPFGRVGSLLFRFLFFAFPLSFLRGCLSSHSSFFPPPLFPRARHLGFVKFLRKVSTTVV